MREVQWQHRYIYFACSLVSVVAFIKMRKGRKNKLQSDLRHSYGYFVRHWICPESRTARTHTCVPGCPMSVFVHIYVACSLVSVVAMCKGRTKKNCNQIRAIPMVVSSGTKDVWSHVRHVHILMCLDVQQVCPSTYLRIREFNETLRTYQWSFTRSRDAVCSYASLTFTGPVCWLWLLLRIECHSHAARNGAAVVCHAEWSMTSTMCYLH